ncbi:MAG: sulfite exporter TauE/SafE family protein [Eubacteriales bacterium]|nr:sulfite exporter TauE/SafE family protein [Eubacteriales bacterium]
MNFVWLFVAGLVSGIVGGMGMGGGTLLIPILTIFLSFKQKNAQAINLLVFIPMSLVALIIHIKNKLVDFKVGIPIIISGIVFSLLGSYLASILSNGLLKKIFAVFLLLVGLNQIIQTIIALKKSKNKPKFDSVKLKMYIK